MRTMHFSGHLYRDAVPRTFRTVDPANPAKAIVSVERFHLLEGFVADRISGWGQTKGANPTKYMTLSGQYDRFKRARLTVSDQDYDLLKKAIEPYLDEEAIKARRKEIPLKQDLTFKATVSSMKSFDQRGNPIQGSEGFNAVELWLMEKDEVKPVFTLAAIEESTEAVGEGTDEMVF